MIPLFELNGKRKLQKPSGTLLHNGFGTFKVLRSDLMDERKRVLTYPSSHPTPTGAFRSLHVLDMTPCSGQFSGTFREEDNKSFLSKSSLIRDFLIQIHLSLSISTCAFTNQTAISIPMNSSLNLSGSRSLYKCDLLHQLYVMTLLAKQALSPAEKKELRDAMTDIVNRIRPGIVPSPPHKLS